MNICVISGPANVGKTKTMHLIDDIFKGSNKYQSLYTNRKDEKDFESVYKNGNQIIGLISIGDSKSAVEAAFERIKEYNINYLICTSRTKGETLDFYEKLSDKVVRISKPYFAIDNAYNENINSFFAKYVCDVLFIIFN